MNFYLVAHILAKLSYEIDVKAGDFSIVDVGKRSEGSLTSVAVPSSAKATAHAKARFIVLFIKLAAPFIRK